MPNKKKNKLLIFVNSYSSQMETFIYNHIKMVASDSLYELTVLCHYYPDNSFNIDENIKVIQTHISSFSSRITSVYKILIHDVPLFFKLLKYGGNTLNLSLFTLANSLKLERYDLVHAHFGQNGKLIAQLMDADLIHSELITQFHGLDITSKKCKRKNYYNLLKKKANMIMVNTQYSLSVVKSLGFNEDKITVLAVGTNSTFFNRKTAVAKDKTLKILFIGRLIELKGAQLIPCIARKMIQLEFTDFEFTIVGEGILKHSIHENANDLEEKIKLTGYKSLLEIKQLLEDSHLLIYPGIADEEGREETQGLIVQEAMFMKLPVIVSKIGGVPEAVINGETGFICMPGDISDFAEKIIRLGNDYDLRKTMGQRGYELAKNKYDILDFHKKITDIYEDIVTKNNFLN